MTGKHLAGPWGIGSHYSIGFSADLGVNRVQI